ncbi:xanthine dehydrogenase small subunit [Xanthobacter autotrophicus]|uniref:xanthine dehydrogenase small subunit n=1 Tax=Xanthobacter TaxID=279 RepID=UPI0024AC6600|nr:xanthine dehydrogenase small subunit [Xanthobacter autotrophicus]MDI4666770.1 xanthine dehydrogenase small subunit [Xanthobacter autotrophicus]
MAIAFLLNGESVREATAAPSMTVLDYLRTRRHLTGTKEGCAEGDCGACTIAIGRAEGDGVRWQAVNACIMLLSQLDGALVKTVEGLGQGDALHPVQQVLAESDGTQCGFCTPGIVMSLYVLQQEGVADDAAMHEALAGNLCRCTGYRPIVDAARALCAAPPALRTAAPAVAAPPSSTAHGTAGELHLFPDNLADLVALRATHSEAVLIAGATDLGLIPSKKRRGFPLVLSTSRVAELKRIVREPGALILGAAVTYADALAPVEAAFPAFGALVRRIGSRQIRAMGTFGGNLGTASPVGDTLPVLLALDAEVELAGPAGSRRMKVDDFLTGYRATALAPDEVIAAIRLPYLAAAEQLCVWKLSRRYDQDISTVLGAFRVRIADGVLVSLTAAFGGMAERAKRARALETALTGAPWGEQAPKGIEAALAADFAPLSDHRASATYRRAAAANLVRRLHLATTRPDLPLEVHAL